MKASRFPPAPVLPPDSVWACQAGRMFNVTHTRLISPDFVQFACQNWGHFETARWSEIYERYIASDAVGGEVVLCRSHNREPLARIEEWRLPEHQLARAPEIIVLGARRPACPPTRWAVTDRQSSRWWSKDKPPVGDCKLEILTARGEPAITIEVDGYRTHFQVNRGHRHPYAGEKLPVPKPVSLVEVMREMEEIWDRWWWSVAEDDKEETEQE